MNKISGFRGQYYFLSNFYLVDVEYDGIVYTNSEAAFQSMKTLSKNNRIAFAYLDPKQAKILGRRVTLRKDWEDVKYNLMYEIVKAKFTQNKDLKNKLLKTGTDILEEENTWGDKEWGVVNGEGENYLGKILMKIRTEIKLTQPIVKS